MGNEKKLQNARNIYFIREYLSKTNLSRKIMQHPRYISILWKISLLMQKFRVKAFEEGAEDFLKTIITVVPSDGSIVILDNTIKLRKRTKKNEYIPKKYGNSESERYYFDENDLKLKHIFTDGVNDLEWPRATQISIYNENGIEERLLTMLDLGNNKRYYSNLVRVPSRIDMIKMQRIYEENKTRKPLEDTYQIRQFVDSLEDLYPGIQEIDPLDLLEMSKYQLLPDTYRPLTKQEQKSIESGDKSIFELKDEEKQDIFNKYKMINAQSGRITEFEEAIKDYMRIDDRGKNELID